MASVTFDVESYTVLTNQQGNTLSGAWRNIVLTSPDLSHGIRHRASLFFFESGSATLGAVTNVDQPNFDGLTAHAFCRKPDFAEWYDILRNEKPLKCAFGYSGPEYDPNQPRRELYWIQLYTGQQEPPGEGPEEVLARLFSGETLDMLRGEASDEQ